MKKIYHQPMLNTFRLEAISYCILSQYHPTIPANNNPQTDVVADTKVVNDWNIWEDFNEEE
ncbi:MAG: hypothetical protein J6W75_12485 [Bacteroidaceae bacterium]|nr:hypothetical protein [Bacteroidaceae bacterium]